MPKIMINGKTLDAPESATVLEVALENDIWIPTLCHNKFLSDYGACRLCLVEVVRNGRSRVTASCTLPVREDMKVITNSERVVRLRKLVMELILASCPNSKAVVEMAEKLGVRSDRLDPDPTNDCIRCGLCVRACEEISTASAINFANRGTRREVTTPFGEINSACVLCGACVFVCPTGSRLLDLARISGRKPQELLSSFDAKLRVRGAIDTPFPQALPNMPAIDPDICLHINRDGCGICEKVCEAGAIRFDDTDKEDELNVGAVIVAPGFSKCDPEKIFNLGYSRSKNILSSIEFERMLSASGPFEGHVVRPSDGRPVKKIAFIQCVGSRDEKYGNKYCSSVCCMYAVKEAVIAKEHQGSVEPTIFYMDLRAYGKDFDKYIERAKSEYGVVFKRSRVFSMEEGLDGRVWVSYENEGGSFEKEAFDLGVLSLGLEPGADFALLAAALGIELNEHNFFKTDSLSPLDASRPGIYVCGAASGPKDIPETVVQASGAAASASVLLAPARNTLTTPKKYPQEKDVAGKEPRIAVFICHCGINIGGVVNVPQVAEYAKALPGVVYAEDNLYTCSQDTQEKIKKVIDEHDANRVVVASCSPRTHEPLFQETVREAGLNKYLFEMANIRDQCSWVHKNEPQKATEKAKDLVRMAVAKSRLKEPLKPLSIPVNRSGLVVGGGLAGITAALTLADQGFEVHLIERSRELGGMARRTYYTIDGKDIQREVASLIERVKKHPRVKVYTNAYIVDVSGYVGNFTTEIMRYRGITSEKIEHGVTIIATGACEHKPNQYLYGKNPRVLTQLELEEKIARDGSDITGCNTLVMILCAGSRVQERPFCSRVCCNQAIKNALRLKQISPEMNIFILYRDMRTYGFHELYYEEARERGVVFIRYTPEYEPQVKNTKGGKGHLRVEVRDSLLGEELAIDADLLALSVPMVPPDDARETAMFYKVPLNDDNFFLEAHVKLRPVDFATDGVFVCGLAHGPKSIDESIAQARAAASRACTILVKDTLMAEGIVCFVEEEICGACGICEVLCPYGAITVDEEKKAAVVNEALCKGCGTCASACPSGAAQQRGFKRSQMSAMVSAALQEV